VVSCRRTGEQSKATRIPPLLLRPGHIRLGDGFVPPLAYCGPVGRANGLPSMRAADYRSSRICFHVTGTAQSAASDRYQSPRRDFLSGDQGTGNPWSASIASLAPAFRNRNLTRFCEFTVRGFGASQGCEACHEPTVSGQRFSHSCDYERHFPDGGRTFCVDRDVLISRVEPIEDGFPSEPSQPTARRAFSCSSKF
jgi:hypothetical protein